MSGESGESIIGKFFGILGFKVDHKGAEDFQKSLDHVKHSVEAIFAVEVFERVAEFIERSVGAASAVSDLSEVTEMAATRIDALGRVAIDNSSSVESMNSAIMGIYRATGQAAMGIGRNVKLFQTLGIAVKDSTGHVKSADTMMGELADKFKGMDMSKVVGTAGRLGLDPQIAKAMKELGGDGWRKEVQSALGKNLLSEEDFKSAGKTETTFKRFHLILGQVATILANQLAPWLRKAVDAFEEFVAEHKAELLDKLHKGMTLLSEVLGKIWQWGEKLFSTLAKMYRGMADSERIGQAFRAILVGIALVKTADVIEKITLAIKNMGMALAKLPLTLTLFSLLVVAVGLLVEDWLGFQKGEESVIGDLEKRWPAAFKVISTAMKGLLGIWDDILAAARALGIIEEKKSATAPGSLARYKEYQQNPPKEGTPEAEEFIALDRMIKSGNHPFQQFQRNVMTGGATANAMASAIGDKPGSIDKTTAAVSAFLAQAEDERARGALSARPGLAAALGDVDAGKDTSGTIYITGTKIQVVADTDARAKMAGDSVRDALSSQRIRNNQPRAF